EPGCSRAPGPPPAQAKERARWGTPAPAAAPGASAADMTTAPMAMPATKALMAATGRRCCTPALCALPQVSASAVFAELHDEVDELAGDDDRLPRLGAVEESGDSL